MRGRRLVAAIGWVVGLGLVAAALQWAGRGPLAPPPLGDPGRWGAWLEERTPIVAAFSLVRLLAVGTLWYLVAATFVGAVLRVAGAASLVRVADRFTIGPIRRMLAGSVGLGLAASGLVAVAAPAVRIPAAVAQTTTTTTTTPTEPATVTMHRLSPVDAPVTQVVAPVPKLETNRWTVKPGECFWSIADSVLTERWGRAPSDAEILPYWRRLIEANRHDLASKADPDLIFPGQVFAVPSP